MSDIPTNATGVHVIGAHAYLYNRSGTYIADHALADGILEATHLDRNATDNRDAAEQWLHTIGYRLATDDNGWLDHHGWLRAVEYTGVVAFEWGSTSPGHYLGSHGVHRATVHRTREGMIGTSGVMWTVMVDGYHVTNADTLAAGKVAADTELRRLAATFAAPVPDPEEPGDVDLHAPSAGPA